MKKEQQYDQGHEVDLLKNLPKQEAYKAPDGYFDSLEAKLSSRISGQPSPGMVRGLFPRLAMAVSLAIAALFVFLYVNDSNDNDHSHVTEKHVIMTVDELEDNVSLAEFDENLLVETIVLNDNTSGSTGGWNEAEDYLIENNVELSLIISEL
jgi:hypothetical protein